MILYAIRHIRTQLYYVASANRSTAPSVFWTRAKADKRRRQLNAKSLDYETVEWDIVERTFANGG